MSYLCDLLLISSLIVIAIITNIASLKQTHLFFVHFSECPVLLFDVNVDEESV